MSLVKKLLEGISSNNKENKQTSEEKSLISKRPNNTEVVTRQNKTVQDFPPDFDPVEHSWEFLTNITETVFTKFSEEKQKAVLDIGLRLLHTGAVYQHVIYNADKGKGAKK